MKKKYLICILINCIVYFSLANSDLYVQLYKKIHNGLVFEIISIMPIIAVSALFGFIGKRKAKEKIADFIKMCAVSYIFIIGIIFVCVMYTMSRFD